MIGPALLGALLVLAAAAWLAIGADVVRSVIAGESTAAWLAVPLVVLGALGAITTHTWRSL